MAAKVITWDWKDQPPLDKILLAAQETLTSAGMFWFTEPDTGGDFYAIIIADRELDEEQVEALLEDSA